LQSSNKDQRPRHRKKRSNETKTQTQPGAFQASEQEPTADEVSKESPQGGFFYVIEAADPSEKVIGVFTQLTNANESAIAYAARYGISATEITDIISSSGWGLRPVKASRKVWLNGTSELSESLNWDDVCKYHLHYEVVRSFLEWSYQISRMASSTSLSMTYPYTDFRCSADYLIAA